VTDAVGKAERLAGRMAARAGGYDEDAAFPERDVEELREEGLLGLMVPARLGGMGAGFEEYVRVAVALAGGNASSALIFNMHASVTGGLASISDEVARGLGARDSFFEARDRILQAAVDGAIYGVAIHVRARRQEVSDPRNEGLLLGGRPSERLPRGRSPGRLAR
jgi:alkylation response protein AidB-like acyl-CoA dehydrogenase